MENVDKAIEIEFDETFYLQRYPDVARTVGPGGWRSAFEHYLHHGQKEGRLPTARTKEPDLGAIRSEAGNNQGVGFLTPTALSVTPSRPLKVAMIGSCMLRAWDLTSVAKDLLKVDLFVVNFLSALPKKSALEIAEYDFAVIQIPLRSVVPDSLIWHLNCNDVDAHQSAFDNSCARLDLQLKNWMQWNSEYGLLMFVCNFFVPQSNPLGRLLPRYNLTNQQYFIEQLNVQLEQKVRQHANAYLFDIDGIATSFGRRHIQDDIVSFFNHNSFLGNEPPQDRIEPVAPLTEYYPWNWGDTVRPAIWAELSAMYRTIRQVDSVKLVVVDLDDTLWKGVSGEMAEIDAHSMTEGWPLGFAEALMYLRKRGVVLAIISKNEEKVIREIFPRVWGKRLLLEHFAAVSVNWRPKAENMTEILATMNLLPRNVIFIDDNPVERAAMQSAFPDVRVLGRHLYWLRRILLWSSETQVATVTEESAQKTEMIQRQFDRETQRKSLSRDEFLASAAPEVEIHQITNDNHPRFARMMELVNKTNQFNTTGRRWKAEELRSLVSSSGRIYIFSVSDSFTSYGLVGVVIVQGSMIEQYVMSCRVLGYNIEQAVLNALVPLLQTGSERIAGRLIETDANFPCRSVFSSSGFEYNGHEWFLPKGATVAAPAHVTVRFAT